MSNFAQFMKKNKTVKENVTHAVTASLTDENGSPLLWTLRPISSRQNAEIRADSMEDIHVKGKSGVIQQKVNTKEYISKLLVASCVVPDLYDAELQDSYGVKTPEDLLFELVDDPGEYDAFMTFVQKFNGFSTSFEDEVEEAKN